jgi:hypothetical protein
MFNIYCKAWKLSINCSKSKVIIISKRKILKIHQLVFALNDEVIGILDSYSYLGCKSYVKDS